MKRRPMPANSASLVFSSVRNELCQGRQELAAQKCERVGIGLRVCYDAVRSAVTPSVTTRSFPDGIGRISAHLD